MKILQHILGVAAICALAMAPARAGSSERITIFAAASLKNALDAVALAYDGAITASYGGSATMARQIAQGAPADIVILANPGWMDWLGDQGALQPDSRIDLLGNTLVLIGPADADPLAPASPPSAAALIARLGPDGRIALGQTNAVPAGIYARDWMQATGLWDGLQTRLAETENVRAALALVARGETPLGVVYASDALAEPRVRVLYAIARDSHPPIRYPAALVAGAGSGAARALDFLRSERAAALFRTHGFAVLTAPGAGD